METQQPPAHYPVTGVCIVADPQKCPPLYTLLLKSHDRRDDCDLGTQSLLQRSPRYLCYSRAYSAPGRQNVLVDLQIVNEKELPAANFTLLDKTTDSAEKALKKKQLAIKMVPRETATTAICDIIFMSKSKRAPEGYTLAGEINGLALCIKVGTVPVETQNFSHAATVAHNRPAPLPPIATSSAPANGPSAVIKPPVPAPRTWTTPVSVSSNPLADVPFLINLKHQDLKKFLNISSSTQRDYRSAVDIKNEYDYQFTLERSAVQKLPLTP